jgi:hypothetical protein
MFFNTSHTTRRARFCIPTVDDAASFRHNRKKNTVLEEGYNYFLKHMIFLIKRERFQVLS